MYLSMLYELEIYVSCNLLYVEIDFSIMFLDKHKNILFELGNFCMIYQYRFGLTVLQKFKYTLMMTRTF